MDKRIANAAALGILLLRSLFALFVLVLAATPLALAQTTIDGENLYKIEEPPAVVNKLAPIDSGEAVTSTGAFTASIPIELPAGRQGLTPSISLDYNSQRGNGLVGVGWALRGFPAIGRMNFGRGVNHDTNDTFALLPDGFGSTASRDNRLVKKPGTINRYHLARNSAGAPLREFEAVSGTGCGNGPCYWIMRDGQGNAYYFGGDAAANASTASPPSAFLWEPDNGLTARRGIAAWALHKVEDIHRNYYQVSYRRGTAGGREVPWTSLDRTLWPTQVVYTLNPANSALRFVRARFEYQGRPDVSPTPGYFNERLSGIYVEGRCTANFVCASIRWYTLGYGTSGESGRSLFTQFQEWGRDPATGAAVSKPMMLLAYSPGGHRTETLSNGLTVEHPMETLQEYPYDFIGLGFLDVWETHVDDTDGDGRPEVVRVFQGETDFNGAPGEGNRYTTLVEVAPGQRLSTQGGFDAPVEVYRNRTDTEQVAGGHGDEWHSLLGDITGDDRADLILYHYAKDGLYVQYLLGDPGFIGGLAAPATWPSNLSWPETSDEVRRAAVVTLGDVNGDQKLDLVVLNHKTNLLLFALGTSTGLASSVQRSFTTTGTLCPEEPIGGLTGPSSSPDCLFFADLVVRDFDGEGCDDVLAVWATGGHPQSTDNYSGIVHWVFAPGSQTTPLQNPTEVTQQVGSRRPIQEVVAGDGNGDGRVDVMLARSGFEGTVPTGVNLHGQFLPYGREIRTLLGGGNVLANRFGDRLLEDDGSSYPFDRQTAGEIFPPATHMATWNHMLADLNGDAIADALHVYRGFFGTRVDFLHLSPTGAFATLLTNDPHRRAVDDPNPWVDGLWFAWTFRSGTTDLNGDGNADLVLSYNGAEAVHVEYALGTSNTSSAFSPFKSLVSPVQGGLPLAAHCLAPTCFYDHGSVHFADTNGDGRQDINLVGNHDAPQPPAGRMRYLVSIPGRPNLLVGIQNGFGGTTTIEYDTAARIAKPGSLPISTASTCAGAGGEGSFSGAACGKADLSSRDLVTRIRVDNGRGFSTNTRIEYSNGRVMPGPLGTRADLGFERITKVTEESGLARVTIYRQDPPFQRLRHSEETWADNCSATPSAPCRVLMGRTRFSFASLRNGLGVEIAGLTERATDDYEAQWSNLTSTLVHTRRMLYDYDPTHFVVAKEQSCTSDAGDNCIVTEHAHTHDTANWLIGRLDATWTTRKNAVGQTVILDMGRMIYDVARPLNVVRRDRLLFEDAEQAICRDVGDPAHWRETCSAELNAGTARWVSVEQNIRYTDWSGVYQYGNVTHSEDALGHAIDFTYDTDYRAFPARTTNALGHLEQRFYDAAGRLGTFRDPNNQGTTTHYDSLGRPWRLITPAIATPEFKGWFYDNWGVLNATLGSQRVRERTYAGVNDWHDFDHYFDGFGSVYQIVDNSGVGTITTTVERSWELEPVARKRFELVLRRSYPRLAADPVRAIEVRFNPVGRPYVMNRVRSEPASGWVVEKQIRRYDYSIAANPSGLWKSVLQTDADLRTERQYTNARGLLAALDDGNGERTSYVYDIANRLRQVTLPAGRTGNITVARYDSWGRRRAFTDDATGTTKFDFDDLGNLTQSTDANGQGVTYTYDALSRIREGTGQSLIAFYVYDEPNHGFSIGRLTSVSDRSGSTRLHYDARGNISRKEVNVSGLGTISYVYTFDQADRVTQKTFPAGLPGEITQNFDYTADGVLKRVRQGTTCFASYTRHNSSKQLLTQETYGTWKAATQSCSSPTTTTNLAYNEDQRLRFLAVTNAAQALLQRLTYDYYPAGNLQTLSDVRGGPNSNIIVNGTHTGETQSFSYDALNRLSTATGPYGSRSYLYDTLGNITQNGSMVVLYPRCPVRSQRCLEGRQGGAGGPVVWSAVHDATGKRLSFDDRDATDGNGTAQWQYSYDELNRLIRVYKDGLLREDLVYDFGGAKAKKTLTLPGSNTITTYYLGDDLELRSNSTSANVFALTYRVSKIATASPGILTRSLSCTPTPGRPVECRWVWSFTAGGAINGQATESAVTAAAGSPFSGDTLSGPVLGSWIHHPNHLGTASVTSQAATGTAVSRLLNEPFGRLVRRDPNCNPGLNGCPGSLGLDGHVRKFNGKEFDEESELYDYGARFYDPVSARFITADDRIRGSGSNPQAFNRFAYVLNNPVKYVDPTGHEPEDAAYEAAAADLFLSFVPVVGPYRDYVVAKEAALATHDAYVEGLGSYGDFAKAQGAQLLAAGFVALDIYTLGTASFSRAAWRTLAVQGGVDGAEHQINRQLLGGERFKNFRQRVDPSDIRGAPPVHEGRGSGHARSGHGVSNQAQAEIVNDAERIFSGVNINGREVDIYYKDGSVVITEAGNKTSSITAYGKVSTKGKTKAVKPEKWASDPDFVEIKIDGENQVIFPNEDRWLRGDWP